MKLFQIPGVLLFAVSCFSNAVADTIAEPYIHADLEYANHLFNAINGAMRQWSSSINHNGMTAFIATVPADVEFYHGTRSEYRINATEWLAFEPEHALLFAGQLHGSPPKHGSHGHPPAPPASHNDEQSGSAGAFHSRQMDNSGHEQQQRLLQPDDDHEQSDPDRSGWQHGYLHTYRTKHPLRLLYVDGQSAAKSTKGTLDLQDVVILRNDLGPPRPGDSRGPLMELERAAALCRRAGAEWNNNIDGIIRMEGGFEVILCSFEEHLDLVSINQATATPSNSNPDLNHRSNMLHYYQAVASRYDGIGGDRVTLDFENMVSLFSHPEAVYLDDFGRPRAVNTTAALKRVREDIDRIARDPQPVNPSINWQAVTDMIVARYADRIAYMASEDCNTLSKLHTEIDFAMHPFINYASRDDKAELDRCTAQFLPRADGQNNAARDAIEHISQTICGSLRLARAANNLEESRHSITSLKEWLNWPIWRRCQGCAFNEVCFLAIWPAGSLDDLEHPRCRSDMTWAPSDDSYWMDEPGHRSAEIAFARRFVAP